MNSELFTIALQSLLTLILLKAAVCRNSFLVVLKADGQHFEGGQYFLTSRHLEYQSPKTFQDFFLLVQMILTYAYIKVDFFGESFDTCC